MNTGITTRTAKTVKTAISVEKKLFDEMEKLAKELGVSRSRVFSMAARELVGKYKGKKLTEAINAALVPETEDDKAYRAAMTQKYLEILDKW